MRYPSCFESFYPRSGPPAKGGHRQASKEGPSMALMTWQSIMLRPSP